MMLSQAASAVTFHRVRGFVFRSALPRLEIARVLMRFDHVASRIVNAVSGGAANATADRTLAHREADRKFRGG